MAPHGIYPCAGDDEWLAIACRDDGDWQALCGVIGETWCGEPRWDGLDGRLADQDRLDQRLAAWTAARDKFETATALQRAGVPAAAVQKPQERVDADSSTGGFGLWPTVTHTKMGRVRIDGLPVHFSETDWRMTRGAPCLGEHTEEVLTRLLGFTADDVARLREEGVV
jgi:crotonobetainyl-CoA:carnitine CoA-transferase CaiB-like acyl-CoA transferase